MTTLDDTRIAVGGYVVRHWDGHYRVMEAAGTCRVLAKKFKTAQAAIKRAEQMDARR